MAAAAPPLTPVLPLARREPGVTIFVDCAAPLGVGRRASFIAAGSFATVWSVQSAGATRTAIKIAHMGPLSPAGREGADAGWRAGTGVPPSGYKGEYRWDSNAQTTLLLEAAVGAAVNAAGAHTGVMEADGLVHERDFLGYTMPDARSGDGWALADTIARRRGRSPAATAALYTDIVAQFTSAVASMHAAGFEDLDIHPSNVLLSTDSESGGVQLRLADCGFAQSLALPPPATLATAWSTRAPEHMTAFGYATTGPAADVWSYGMTLIVLLTGLLPITVADEERIVGLLGRLIGVPTSDDMFAFTAAGMPAAGRARLLAAAQRGAARHGLPSLREWVVTRLPTHVPHALVDAIIASVQWNPAARASIFETLQSPILHHYISPQHRALATLAHVPRSRIWCACAWRGVLAMGRTQIPPPPAAASGGLMRPVLDALGLAVAASFAERRGELLTECRPSRYLHTVWTAFVWRDILLADVGDWDAAATPTLVAAAVAGWTLATRPFASLAFATPRWFTTAWRAAAAATAPSGRGSGWERIRAAQPAMGHDALIAEVWGHVARFDAVAACRFFRGSPMEVLAVASCVHPVLINPLRIGLAPGVYRGGDDAVAELAVVFLARCVDCAVVRAAPVTAAAYACAVLGVAACGREGGVAIGPARVGPFEFAVGAVDFQLPDEALLRAVAAAVMRPATARACGAFDAVFRVYAAATVALERGQL